MRLGYEWFILRLTCWQGDASFFFLSITMRSIEKPKQPWFTFDTHIWKLLSWKIESSFRGIVRQTRNRVLYHWIYIRKFNDTARFPCTDQWTFHLHKMYCFLFSEHFLEHFLLKLILAWGSRYTNKTTSSRVKERYLRRRPFMMSALIE